MLVWHVRPGSHAVKYAQERKGVRKKIHRNDFSGHSGQIAQMATDIEAARLNGCYNAARIKDAEEQVTFVKGSRHGQGFLLRRLLPSKVTSVGALPKSTGDTVSQG